ncbi:MAG: zinc ribbon protein [Rhodocyclales bacterium]|nr:zinc ribbon protein [Rhodocyclales bacterium]
MNVCPACNAENLDGKTFCHQCGGALSPPATVDCVVCAAPVKAGAKFCKRCGSAQPVASAAPPAPVAPPAPTAPNTPFTGAARQPYEEDDDANKTVILTPQARDAMLARVREEAQQSSLAAASASRPAAAPVQQDHRDPAPKSAATMSVSMHDQAKAQHKAPQRNYLALGLGAGAFIVAALVSALLLMSGHSPEQPGVVIDTASVPQAEASAAVDASQSVPAVLASAPLPEPQSAPLIQPEPSTPAAVPPAPVPVAAEPVPPPLPKATPGETDKTSQEAAAAVKKPKPKPKQDAAAAKRKQAEEALQRLLNQ